MPVDDPVQLSRYLCAYFRLLPIPDLLVEGKYQLLRCNINVSERP
jgi:hypothetical protein